MSDITRSLINSLLPDGVLWDYKEDGDLDLLLGGIADNVEYVQLFLSNLANIRNPEKTDILSDLEKEYGAVPDADLTEAERRIRLAVLKNDRISDGSASFLENRLQDSGFDLHVYQNDPPIDPSILNSGLYQMYAGGYNAYAGNVGAYAAGIGIDLIVNGDLYYNDGTLIEYDLPTDSGYFPLIFFIGGAVTRDPVTNEILTLESATIASSRRFELIKLILKYKPMHSWGYLKVLYT